MSLNYKFNCMPIDFKFYYYVLIISLINMVY